MLRKRRQDPRSGYDFFFKFFPSISKGHLAAPPPPPSGRSGTLTRVRCKIRCFFSPPTQFIALRGRERAGQQTNGDLFKRKKIFDDASDRSHTLRFVSPFFFSLLLYCCGSSSRSFSSSLTYTLSAYRFAEPVRYHQPSQRWGNRVFISLATTDRQLCVLRVRSVRINRPSVRIEKTTKNNMFRSVSCTSLYRRLLDRIAFSSCIDFTPKHCLAGLQRLFPPTVFVRNTLTGHDVFFGRCFSLDSRGTRDSKFTIVRSMYSNSK